MEERQARDLPFCDVIMKGGITSGVIYPEMISDLARHYRLKSVGGTSAGAIAAALAVAAEHARAKGKGENGYDELRRLPAWLGEQAAGGRGSNLLQLFQPTARAAKLFRLLVATLPGEAPGESWRSRLAHSLSVALAGYPLWALAGAVPGLLLMVALLNGGAGGRPVAWGLGLAVSVLVVGLVSLLALAAGVALDASKILPRQGFGLCPGFGKDAAEGAPPALAQWLTEKINQVAGKDLQAEGPLTFGDLWGTRPQKAVPDDDTPFFPAPGERRIDLQMMTTALTLGRPFRMPFENRTFFFDADEWRGLFPEPVVRFMVEHPGYVDPEDIPVFRGKALHPLPEPADLPVVVATRMSLSFPVLLSAVPLYGVDFSSLETALIREHNRQEGADRIPYEAQRCWFSDGGIGSNFPIHFFDSPIPSWPTFGINLRPRRPETHPDPDLYRPRRNADGRSGWWSPIGSLPGFLGAIVTTMQNWRDNTQMAVPGYRDRIVHIYHSEKEGGMNLNMDPEVIRSLSDRGRKAALELLGGFAGLVPDPEVAAGRKKADTTWENHRWLRFLSAMGLIEEAVFEIAAAVKGPAEPTIASLLDAPPSYKSGWTEAREAHARKVLKDVVELAESWGQDREADRLSSTAPRPLPELRIGPRV
jgi:predicted acylesterase/phospholipase RssA